MASVTIDGTVFESQDLEIIATLVLAYCMLNGSSTEQAWNSASELQVSTWNVEK